MKKYYKWIFVAILVLVLFMYVFLTPIGALRFKILLTGHPIKAVTSTISDTPNYPNHTTNNQIGYTLHNPPYEADTNSELCNWIVKKYSIFYIAEYYGWG